LVPGHIVLDISQDEVGGTRLVNIFNVCDQPVQPVVSGFQPVQEQISHSGGKNLNTLPASAHQNTQVLVSQTFEKPQIIGQHSGTNLQSIYNQQNVEGFQSVQGQCLDFSQHSAVSNHNNDISITSQHRQLAHSAPRQSSSSREYHPIPVFDNHSVSSHKHIQVSVSSTYCKDTNSPQHILLTQPLQNRPGEIIHKDDISYQHVIVPAPSSDVSLNRHDREQHRAGQHNRPPLLTSIPKLPVSRSDVMHDREQLPARHSQLIGNNSSLCKGIDSVNTQDMSNPDLYSKNYKIIHPHPGGVLSPSIKAMAVDIQSQSDDGQRKGVVHYQNPESALQSYSNLQNVPKKGTRNIQALRNSAQIYNPFIEPNEKIIESTGLEILATSALGHQGQGKRDKLPERVSADIRSHVPGVVYKSPAQVKLSSGNLGHLAEKSKMVVPRQPGSAKIGEVGVLTDNLGVRIPQTSVPISHTSVVRNSQTHLSPRPHIPSSLLHSVTMATHKLDGVDGRKKRATQLTAKALKLMQKPSSTQEVPIRELCGVSSKSSDIRKMNDTVMTVTSESNKQCIERPEEGMPTSNSIAPVTSRLPAPDPKIFQPPASCVKLKELLLRRTKTTVSNLFYEEGTSEKVDEQIVQDNVSDRVCTNDDIGSLPDLISQTDVELSDGPEENVPKTRKHKSIKPVKISKRKRSDRSSRSSVSKSTSSKKGTLDDAPVGSRRKRHKSNTGFTGESFAEMPRFQPARASKRKKDSKGQSRCLFPDFSTKKQTPTNSEVDSVNEQDYVAREKLNAKGKKTRLYECKICHALRNSVGNMQRHLVAHRKVFKCTCCDVNFSTKNGLYFHKKKKSGNKFDCSLCKFSTYYVPFLRAHMKRSHPEKDEKVFCDICGKSLKNKMSLKSHLQSHKSQDIKEVCGECGKLFTSVKYLRRHQKRVHSIKDHVCTYSRCDKSFPSKCQLKAHVDRVHLKVHKFTCTYPNCEHFSKWLKCSSIFVCIIQKNGHFLVTRRIVEKHFVQGTILSSTCVSIRMRNRSIVNTVTILAGKRML
jgi:hypothetical protein